MTARDSRTVLCLDLVCFACTNGNLKQNESFFFLYFFLSLLPLFVNVYSFANFNSILHCEVEHSPDAVLRYVLPVDIKEESSL